MCSSAKNSQFHVVSQGNASSYAATTGSRSSHQRCSVKQGVHKFHRETPVLESFFDKVAGLQVCNFIKKRLQQSYFPAKFVKFLKAPILKNRQMAASMSCLFHKVKSSKCKGHDIHHVQKP